VRALSPVDLAVSKIGRFEDDDRRDIAALAHHGLITQRAVRRAEEGFRTTSAIPTESVPRSARLPVDRSKFATDVATVKPVRADVLPRRVLSNFPPSRLLASVRKCVIWVDADRREPVVTKRPNRSPGRHRLGLLAHGFPCRVPQERSSGRASSGHARTVNGRDRQRRLIVRSLNCSARRGCAVTPVVAVISPLRGTP
jgi:hypothetical protein